MKLIRDEFTELPVSRERKRQLRALKAGHCVVAGCKLPLATKTHCEQHADETNERNKRRHVRRTLPRGPYWTARKKRAAGEAWK